MSVVSLSSVLDYIDLPIQAAATTRYSNRLYKGKRMKERPTSLFLVISPLRAVCIGLTVELTNLCFAGLCTGPTHGTCTRRMREKTFLRTRP